MESRVFLGVVALAFIAHFASGSDLACHLMCPLIYAPVCGSDGKTYSNECFLNVEKSCKNKDISVVHSGNCDSGNKRSNDIQCLPHMKSGACTREYMPICGSDGKTYGNRCTYCYAMYQLQDKGIELGVSHMGECSVQASSPDHDCPASSKQGICTDEYAPVCASDGNTYATKCTMCAAMYERQKQGENIHIHVIHNGPCKETAAENPECLPREKKGVCTFEYMPVCDSTGATQPNKCTFCYVQAMAEAEGRQLTIQHRGECKAKRSEDDDCPESSKHGICTLEYAPVCASNGRTYNSKCFMCASMYEKQQQGEDIHLTVVHEGMCDLKKRTVDDADCPASSKHGICTLEYAPVCASNGKTYSNKCFMCGDMYEKQQQGENIHLTVVHQGMCDRKKRTVDIPDCPASSKQGICTLEWDPICASNGVTYGNHCGMCYDMYKCQEGGGNDCVLTIVKHGTC